MMIKNIIFLLLLLIPTSGRALDVGSIHSKGSILVDNNVGIGTSIPMTDGNISSKGFVALGNSTGGSFPNFGAAFMNTNPSGVEGVALYDSTGRLSLGFIHGNHTNGTASDLSALFTNNQLLVFADVSTGGAMAIDNFNKKVSIGLNPDILNTLDVGGGVSIGTYAQLVVAPTNGVIISGNVGISTTAPGGALDVGSGSICLGHTCNSSWPAASGNYWLLTAGAGNVGISTMNTVGIGTTSGIGAGLVVMNGNVGIGTWVPDDSLEVVGQIEADKILSNGNIQSGSGNISGANFVVTGAGNFTATSSGGVILNTGNIGIGTAIARQRLDVRGPSYFSNNVGIGTFNPGQMLDVSGNIRGVSGVFLNSQSTGASISNNDCGTLTQGVMVTSPSSTDQAGAVTAGTAAGNLLTCKITFGLSHASAPANCTCNDKTTPLALAATATSSAVTCTSLATVVNAVIGYTCNWTDQ